MEESQEGNQPETRSRFKVGDRVIIARPVFGCQGAKDKTGKIISLTASHPAYNGLTVSDNKNKELVIVQLENNNST